jgi:hypothetical protein
MIVLAICKGLSVSIDGKRRTFLFCIPSLDKIREENTMEGPERMACNCSELGTLDRKVSIWYPKYGFRTRLET